MCAGLFIYLLSSASPARKVDFYKYHRCARRTGACLRPCHSLANVRYCAVP